MLTTIKNQTGKALVVASVLALLGGCATSSELDSVRQMAQQAMDTANNAAGQADRASQAAQAASQRADSAARRADAAMLEAEGAQACCDQNSARMNRLLERSMQK